MKWLTYRTDLLLKTLLLLCLKGLEAQNKFDLRNPIVKAIVLNSKAASIKAWMDAKINPCDNFFEYSCNNWLRINSAATLELYNTNNFEEMSNALLFKIKNLLNQKESEQDHQNEHMHKVRAFYRSCLSTKDNREAYVKALKLMYRQYGEFSFVERSRKWHLLRNKFDWWSVMARLNLNYGKSVILSLDIQNDVKNSNRTMLYLGPPALLVGEPFVVKRIAQQMTAIFELPAAEALEDTLRILNFEAELSEGGSSNLSVETLEELLSRYPMPEVAKKYANYFDMEKFLKLALNTSRLPEEIYLYDEAYLKNLAKVLKNAAPHTIEDYILWVLLDDYLVDFNTQNWQEFCGEKTKTYFGKFLNHEVYKSFRNPEYEQDLKELWQEIKQAFMRALNDTNYDDWMSPQVKQAALKKLRKIRLVLNTYDEENFDLFFKDLHIDPQNYVANIERILLKLESLRTDKMAKQTASLDATQEMSFTPIYEHFENTINIPVALLQPFRLWSPVYPKATKYATIGFLLAHEMIHGFDDMGRHYDGQGQLSDWWDKDSSREFERRRQCFQQQYNRYIYGSDVEDMEASQAENIADNGAIQLAFAAYYHWRTTENASMPQNGDAKNTEVFSKLPYNEWQLFFISFAQLWCSDVHPKFKDLQGTHAPSKYRVIGSLSNFEGFSQVFQCPSGSEMNPSTKCVIY
ncbi:membrane metallo-endopeptidase-like 1 [Stomoxys calcitrans]|uniref:membrane metallo-endopeptidase-like 1 n=1 Tax=Stomoxys calcitrans TaxID=35570 RepID=UPI0027E275A1|nr:membrane metallo-endopeptidase-like 1 [Stomoxys calcitrans]